METPHCYLPLVVTSAVLQFDSRTQEEIAAERDAGRPEEDLAARAMRDEDMFHYGNQPIRYDRWDTGDSWVPPAIEAAGEGKLFPDVRELQAREDAKRQAKRDALLDRWVGVACRRVSNVRVQRVHWSRATLADAFCIAYNPCRSWI